MDEIEEYAFIFFFRQNRSGLSLPDEYIRYGEILEHIRQLLLETIMPLQAEHVVNLSQLAEEIMVTLANFDAVVERKDKFAGLYYKYVSGNYAHARLSVLDGSSINDSAREIGDRFFPDVFSGYSRTIVGDEDTAVAADVAVPASDRIVRLNDNQRTVIEPPLDSLIDSLQADNGAPDSPGFRERVLGQLRAGRELLRAGEFRAFILYQTLFRGLIELAAKYKDHAIGAAASHLVELLIDHVFGIAP